MTAAREILELSGRTIDLDAELARDVGLPWLIRDARTALPVAVSFAWQVVDELQLLEIATHPRARRRGHALVLLGELIAHAKREGLRLVLLEVRRSNLAAIALYERVGFRSTGLRRGYYANPSDDALEMRLTLDPITREIVANDA